MKELFAALVIAVASHAHAHDLQHRVEEGTAVSVRIFRADESDFDFERYEVYRAGEESPFQVGRTDARGRVVFLPDRAGTWRVKVFSEDGHGVDLSFSTDAKGAAEAESEPFLERHVRVVLGASLIFGVFGLVALFSRRGGRS